MAVASFLSLTRGRSNVKWMTAYPRSTGLHENSKGAANRKTESNTDYIGHESKFA